MTDAPIISLTWITDEQGTRTPYPDFIEQTHVEQLLAELHVRSSDVFVSSYPKSGTTWLQQICHLLVHEGVQGQRSPLDTVPWIEAHMLPEKPDLAALEARRERRWMQIHAPWSLAPKGPGARYLYVARNPRDVAVSFFHHQRAKQSNPAYTGDFRHFVECFIRGEVPFGSWFEHVREWWRESQRRDDILFLRFEDMIHELGRELDRIVSFLGLELDAQQRAAIVEQSSFANMKQLGIGEPKGTFRSREGESAHLRKGQIGDWVNYFDAAQIEALDAVYQRELAGSGLAFEWNP